MGETKAPSHLRSAQGARAFAEQWRLTQPFLRLGEWRLPDEIYDMMEAYAHQRVREMQEEAESIVFRVFRDHKRSQELGDYDEVYPMNLSNLGKEISSRLRQRFGDMSER